MLVEIHGELRPENALDEYCKANEDTCKKEPYKEKFGYGDRPLVVRPPTSSPFGLVTELELNGPQNPCKGSWIQTANSYGFENMLFGAYKLQLNEVTIRLTPVDDPHHNVSAEDGACLKEGFYLIKRLVLEPARQGRVQCKAISLVIDGKDCTPVRTTTLENTFAPEGVPYTLTIMENEAGHQIKQTCASPTGWRPGAHLACVTASKAKPGEVTYYDGPETRPRAKREFQSTSDQQTGRHISTGQTRPIKRRQIEHAYKFKET
ncbi:hypothetical protein M011DRAFT_478501 [Sporormia fimetaria CBS 119925]|uniref:Uncharacterized protein n=1 Tax=Sporormia fimetaria CBS 119925 TaxID=1340428 RepID=A0A6A6VAE4_9PLEO|nr:hypothetical protein M011DRAFT_478501 [Sporormia fimetaria CBS 119925]